jgi:hypothetical protein
MIVAGPEQKKVTLKLFYPFEGSSQFEGLKTGNIPYLEFRRQPFSRWIFSV